MRPALALAGLATLAAIGLWACGKEPPDPEADTRATARARAAGFYRPPNDRIPSRLATNPGTPWGDYVGSKECKACHEKEYADWRNSYHSKTLYDAVPETVFGDFSGNVVFRDVAFPYTVRPYRSGAKMYMQVERNLGWRLPEHVIAAAKRIGRNPEDVYGGGLPANPLGHWEILYSFGNRRHQPYVARAPDGRYWVLPVFWNDVTKDWRFNGWRSYTNTCANCHVTGIKTVAVPPPADPDAGRPPPPFEGALPIPEANPRWSRWIPAPAKEGWAEGAVSCELCHGPGRSHVETTRRLGDAAYRAYLAGGGAPTIYDPGKDTPENRMKQCDSCHNFMAESPVTWVPKPTGYDHEMLFHRIRPEDDVDPYTGERKQMQFYLDGTDMSPCTVGRVFRDSKMGRTGAIECRTCHESHGNDDWADLRRPVQGNHLCIECHLGNHKELADPKVLEAHTRHPASGPGSSCVECHMRRDKKFTNGVEVMSDELYSHDFGIPTGEESPLGPGPSCNVCHTDRDAAWTRTWIRRWRDERTKAPAAGK